MKNEVCKDMLLLDKATCDKAEEIGGACAVSFSLLEQAISPQHLHRMDILAWRRQSSPECLPLIIRGIKKNPHLSELLYY